MESPQPGLDRPIISIVGDKVALGPRRRGLVPLALKWYNDFEVMRTYGSRFRMRTLEAAEQGYDGASKGGADYADFAIYELPTMRAIGYTALEEIDHFDRTAKFILLIGEKDCWGKGYGTETTRLMLDYGFTALGLHNIMLTVFSFNERGIRAYTRAGFRIVGRRREAHRFGGRPYDVIYMDCLASEFQSPVLHTLLPQD
jgi:RimJ/RimL family protein N-acetyltransferase